MAEERIPLIETVDLKKYFKVGDKSYLHAVDGINMKVYPGETIGVVGESGCGKSTLGRTILRLIEPTSGQILYNGEDITKLNARQMKRMRQEMQIIFQDPYASLDPRKSVIEIIADTLANNEPILLRGFGTIKTVQRAARPARNISKGTTMMLPPTKQVKFIAYNELKERINHHGHYAILQ